MAEKKHHVSEAKVALVKALAKEMNGCRTILVASCKGLPSAQFNDIRKKLRDVAVVKMVKKTAALRAIENTGNASMKGLENEITADVAFFFSNEEPFSLSARLSENQIPSKARAGDIALEDIEIQPGLTDLVPGPAISELSGVGLKVAVKEGKLDIVKGAIVARAGDKIKENVASVLSKLGISPMRVGFIPIAAYDKNDNKVYVGIKIDKEGTLNELKEMIRKALGFAVGVKYSTQDTIRYFISRAGMEEKAIQNLIDKTTKEDK